MAMIRPNVHLVRAWDTGVSRSVSNEEVQAGFSLASKDFEFSITSDQETIDSDHSKPVKA